MARDSLTLDLEYGNGVTANGCLGYYVSSADCYTCYILNAMDSEYFLAPKPLVEWSN